MSSPTFFVNKFFKRSDRFEKCYATSLEVIHIWLNGPFSSFRLFLFSKTTKLLNFWKCVKISFQNTTLTSRVWANTLDKYRDIAFWRYVYSRISKKVSTLNACAIWWASGEKIVPLENKNNVMHISPEWNCLPRLIWLGFRSEWFSNPFAFSDCIWNCCAEQNWNTTGIWRYSATV